MNIQDVLSQILNLENDPNSLKQLAGRVNEIIAPIPVVHLCLVKYGMLAEIWNSESLDESSET